MSRTRRGAHDTLPRVRVVPSTGEPCADFTGELQRSRDGRTVTAGESSRTQVVRRRLPQAGQRSRIVLLVWMTKSGRALTGDASPVRGGCCGSRWRVAECRSVRSADEAISQAAPGRVSLRLPIRVRMTLWYAALLSIIVAGV